MQTMNKFKLSSTLIYLLVANLLSPIFSSAQVGVGINYAGNVPNTSALLDIDAGTGTKKGLLIPRIALVSSTDAATIANPATSLMVYNLGSGGLSPAGYYYNSGTTVAPAWVRFVTSDPSSQPIPTAQYPTFDGSSPFLLLGALWVGYDATASSWKYNKQAAGRGITDPGNPNTWTVNGTTINYFNGNLNKLPSGTHINNRYDPETMASKYTQDDIMVKTGTYWTDKYETRIIDVSGPTWKDNDDAAAADPADTDIRGNGQGLPPTWMAFSQKANGSSGMSWFVAQKAAGNAGKRLITNAEWQLASSGTLRGDATPQPTYGEDWSTLTITDQDISMFGIVGMVGSLNEWVADWGQYGPDNGLATGATKDQGASYGNDVAWNVAGAALTNNTSISGGGYVYVAGLPAAIIRSGSSDHGTGAGVFDFYTVASPTFWYPRQGFRCAR
jgi:formylglycine-generating enzyme required for sulfatase activity